MMNQLKPMAALTLVMTISSAAIAGIVEAQPGENQKAESVPTAPPAASAQQGNLPMAPGRQGGMPPMQAQQEGMPMMHGPQGSMPMMPEQYGDMPGMQGEGGMPQMPEQQGEMPMMPWQQEQGGMPMMQGYPGGMHRGRGYDQYNSMPMPYAYQGGRPAMGPRGMMRNRMSGHNKEEMQRHRQAMEVHMSNIEKLLKELIELEKAKASSQ